MVTITETQSDQAFLGDGATPANGSSASFFPDLTEHPLLDEAAWLQLRAGVLTPDDCTELVTTRADRLDFLTGVRLMGLDHDRYGTPQEPKPQQLLVVDMLAAGRRINGIMMPRRSTKTTTILAVLLGRCANRPRQNSAFTLATTGLKAREKFRHEVLDILETAYPDPKTRPVKLGWQAGSEAVRFPNGSVFAVHAPLGDNFRGSAYDAVLIDESGRAKPDMTEDLLAAIPPTFDTTGGQFIVTGTADKIRAGNLLYEVLVTKADELAAGILRYGAPDSTSDDELASWEPTEDHPTGHVRELVQAHHPGIGNLTSLDDVRVNYALQPRQKFVFEYLGIFGDEGGTSRLIPASQWAGGLVPGAAPPAPADARYSLAFAVHPDGLWASIAAVWQHELAPADLVAQALDVAGAPRPVRTAARLIHHQQGVRGFWQRLLVLARAAGVPIIYDGASQAAAVEVEQLNRATPRPRFTVAKTLDVRQGASKLLKLLDAGDLAHWAQDPLDRAAAVAVKRAIGTYGGFGIGRPKDDPDADITPLEAVSLALQYAPDPAPAAAGLAGAIVFS